MVWDSHDHPSDNDYVSASVVPDVVAFMVASRCCESLSGYSGDVIIVLKHFAYNPTDVYVGFIFSDLNCVLLP